MTPKRVTTMRLEDEQLEGLRLIWERDGIPVAEQVRRAIRAWLIQRGVGKEEKTERKRVATRKRS